LEHVFEFTLFKLDPAEELKSNLLKTITECPFDIGNSPIYRRIKRLEEDVFGLIEQRKKRWNLLILLCLAEKKTDLWENNMIAFKGIGPIGYHQIWGSISNFYNSPFVLVSLIQNIKAQKPFS